MKLFSLLYQGDVHPSSDEKIIAAEDYSTLISAMKVIEKAQIDSSKLRDKTEKKCKTLKEEATQSGFEEGLSKFNEHIFYLDRELKTLKHQLQQLVLPIALKAAKRIVGKELELFPETIIDIVIQALQPVTENHRVTIFVSKTDKEILDAHKPQIKEILQHAENLTIQEKIDITPGGCIIQTEAGMINATIENQWKALERAFEKYTQSSS